MKTRDGKIQAGVVAAATLMLALPATAAADPVISKPPAVSGDTVVGNTVKAAGYVFDGGQPSWQWLRCDGTDLGSCHRIDGATSDSYVIAADDLGRRLRVWLTVRQRRERDDAVSDPSSVVTQPPPPPKPTPTPSPSPSPTPTPSPAPSPAPPAPAAPAVPLAPQFPSGAVLGVQKAKPRMMRPVPVVRIRGRTTPGGARITLLTVRAPRGARISLTCRGRSCPVKEWARATKLTRLLRFQRVLAAGTRLTIRVTKPGRIGKYTRIVIRDGLAPQRRDRCLAPGSSKPRRCPSV